VFFLALGCGDPSGLPSEPKAVDTSVSEFFGGVASIALEKTTNGLDADEPPGPTIPPGEPVVWEYRVTNNGSETLDFVYVVDDQEGPICTIGTLTAGSEAVCRREGVAQADPYVNEGTVFGNALLASVSSSDLSHYNGAASGTAGVDILIKPGDEAPCLNPRSKGRLPVAILGSPTFDVATVDPNTVLAGDAVPPVKWGRNQEDVTGDGLPDWVFHFETPALSAAGLLMEGEELVLTGQTSDEGEFSGSDLVRVVGGALCRGEGSAGGKGKG
jgi:hypothetical protein